MQRPISRRRFLEQSAQVALTAGAAGSLLAACGSAATGTSASTKTTITFWNAYNVTDPENQTLLNKVIPAFQQKYPNITVKSQNIPYNSLLQKLIATVAGGSGPDVVRTDIIWMPQLAKIGALVPTDDIVAQRKNEFYPGPLATCVYKGKYYGLPLDTNTRVIFYDKALLSQAGFSQPPTTSDEFQTMATKITEMNKSFYGYAESGLDPWNILPWIWSFGGSVTMAFGVYMLKGFFEELPQELFDAAAIDGSGIFRTFWSLALPLARPALAAVIIFSFAANWEEFTWAATSTNDAALYTLPVAIQQYYSAHGTNWGIIFAASVMAILPEVLVFLIFQRQFVSGIRSGGMKG